MGNKKGDIMKKLLIVALLLVASQAWGNSVILEDGLPYFWNQYTLEVKYNNGQGYLERTLVYSSCWDSAWFYKEGDTWRTEANGVQWNGGAAQTITYHNYVGDISNPKLINITVIFLFGQDGEYIGNINGIGAGSLANGDAVYLQPIYECTPNYGLPPAGTIHTD